MLFRSPYLTATGQAGEVERTLGDEGLQVLAESALALSEGRYYDATAAYPERCVLDRLIRMLVERRSYGALYAAVTDVQNAALRCYIRQRVLEEEGKEPGPFDYPSPDGLLELWAGDWAFDGYDWILGDPMVNGCLTIDPRYDRVDVWIDGERYTAQHVPGSSTLVPDPALEYPDGINEPVVPLDTLFDQVRGIDYGCC